MKKIIFTIAVTGIFMVTSAFHTPSLEKLISKTGHISFFSHTVMEDISANNYSVISTLNTASGELVYSVPMQGFEFKKALMQKHYNSSKFLNTKKYPKSKFKGQISNLETVDFSTDGTYNVAVQGNMTIHGVTNEVSEKATIIVNGNKITVTTKIKLKLADYNIKFKGGKPATNIAKTIDVTSTSEFLK